MSNTIKNDGPESKSEDPNGPENNLNDLNKYDNIYD